MRYVYKALLALFIPFTGMAQDDLMDLLDEGETTEVVDATFKGTRLINMQTNETPAPGVLQFMFLHRFGAINDDFLYNFFGLDNAIVRLGLDYAFNDWLNVGIGRSSNNKTTDGFVKLNLLRQKRGAQPFPVSVTWYSAGFLSMDRNRNFDLTSDRLTYVHQLIIARKMNKSISLMLTPSVVHFNLTREAAQPNTVGVLAMGGRFKINQRIAITAEYAPQLANPNFRTGSDGQRIDYQNGLSIGVDIETGGHVFQLHLTNSRSIIDPDWMAGPATGNWLDGDIYFGFNISRVFTVKEPKRPG